MITKLAPTPRGGSAHSLLVYLLGEELTPKVVHALRNEALHPSQVIGLAKVFAEARLRADLGAGAIWSPSSGKGTRPSSIFVEGCSSLENASRDMEAAARTNGRVKVSVRQLIHSISAEEAATVDDATLVSAARQIKNACFPGHQAVYTVHRDTPKPHVHTMVCAVNPRTMKAFNAASIKPRLHKATREAELRHGLKDDHGYYVIRDRGLPTQRIEVRTNEEARAWRIARRDGRVVEKERLEGLSRTFIGDSDGLEDPGDRRDRLLAKWTEYLDECSHRKEKPLYADLYRIAGELACVVDRDPKSGSLRLNLQERAEPNKQGLRVMFGAKLDAVERGSLGTVEAVKGWNVDLRLDDGRSVSVDPKDYRSLCVVAHESPAEDEHDEPRVTIARWRPSEHAFALNAKDMARGPLDDGATGSKGEREQQKVARERRAWLSALPDQHDAEEEAAREILRDPGRVARDITAHEATFSREEIDRRTFSLHSDAWSDLTDYVLAHDPELHMLSADTETPLLTTKAQHQREREMEALAAKLGAERDPLFNRAMLAQAIAASEKALGITFSAEQRRVFPLLERRFAVVQGDPGVGKTVLQDVQRRYCELTGREIGGLATSQFAAENLGKQSGIKTVNSARGLAHEKRGEVLIRRNSRTIVDETSMFSVEAALAVLQRIDAGGAAGGMFIGDQAQLPNIAAGDTMRVLTRAARKAQAYTELTEVHRHKGEMAWLSAASPAGGKAIRERDAAGIRRYCETLWDHGLIVQHDDRKAEVEAKAADLFAALQRDEKALAPGFERQDALYVNRRIRQLLGHEGTSSLPAFKLQNGAREIVPGDRLMFVKNAEKKYGVLNSDSCLVLKVQRRCLTVKLDKDGRTIEVDPLKYPHLEYAWAVTTHKSQGLSSPLVIASVTSMDTVESLHVALTRCELGLRVHTRMSREEFLDHFTSERALRGKTDALLFDELVQRTGGPETPWAIAVGRALKDDADPLRHQHAREMAEVDAARQVAVAEIMRRYGQQRERVGEAGNDRLGAERREKKMAALAAGERREVAAVYEHSPSESFLDWAKRRREEVEREAPFLEKQSAQRAARAVARSDEEGRTRAAKPTRAVVEIRRAAAVEPEIEPEQKQRRRMRR